MKRLILAWRKRREHQRQMKRFFALFEQESIALRDAMLALAEVYADAARMAAENQRKEA